MPTRVAVLPRNVVLLGCRENWLWGLGHQQFPQLAHVLAQKGLGVLLPPEPGLVTVSLRHGSLTGKLWTCGEAQLQL
jgi:hypothetical protein